MKWIFKSDFPNPFSPRTMIISVRFQNNHDIHTSQNEILLLRFFSIELDISLRRCLVSCMEAIRHTDKSRALLEGFLQLLGRNEHQIILAFRVGFNCALCFLYLTFCQMWGKQAEHAGFTTVLHLQGSSRQGQLAIHCCTKHSLTPSSPPSLCVFWCDFTHIPSSSLWLTNSAELQPRDENEKKSTGHT